MFAIVLFLFTLLPSIVLSQELRNFRELQLPNATGPYSLTFDLLGNFYTGDADGRILRFDQRNGFLDYAFTTPTRSKAVCDGTNDTTLGPTCGRPLGLDFYLKTGVIYVADRYRGFLVVTPNGRLAVQIATSEDGVPFRYLNDVEVDQITGEVYFTEAATTDPPSPGQPLLESITGTTGRLLRYDPRTGQVNVLLTGLAGASGVALSLARDYLVISEYLANRIRRFYLRGPRALQNDILISNLTGRPLSITRYLSTFYVAVRNIVNVGPGPAITINPTVVQFDGTGRIRRNLDLSPFYGNRTVTEFTQRGLQYYAGSLNAAFVGVFNS